MTTKDLKEMLMVKNVKVAAPLGNVEQELRIINATPELKSKAQFVADIHGIEVTEILANWKPEDIEMEAFKLNEDPDNI